MNYPIKTLSQLRPVLQGFRKQAGLTQAAVASQLGITQQSYAQIEANPASTSVERLFRIMRLLNVEWTLADDQATAETEQISLAERPTSPAAPTPAAAVGKKTLQGKRTRLTGPSSVLPPGGKKENW